jgi:hypothetical protein
MSQRGTSKFGRDAAGVWSRDTEGLPCYDWDRHLLARDLCALPHCLGTGLLQASADQTGVLRLLAGPLGDRVAVPTPTAGCSSALRLDLGSGGRLLRLLPLVAPDAWQPQVRYGCGYVSYTLSVRGPDLPLHFELRVDIVACPGKPYLLVEVALRPGGGEGEGVPCVLTVISDVGECDHHPPRAAARYAREGVAMVSLGQGYGDAFLAGSAGWESAALPGRLELRRSLTLRPGEAVSMRLLLGYSQACSRQWLRDQFEGLTVASIKARQAPLLQVPPLVGPELWMREDLLWCRSALAAFQAPESSGQRIILHPVVGLRVCRTAHRLALCPFLQCVFPALVHDTLVAVALQQGSDGQLPNTLGGALPEGHPDPQSDRSDTEVAFLWACARWLAEPEHSALLALRLPEGSPKGSTFADRLVLAAAWIRDRIGRGPHGLVRLLAGDWSGALDAAGTGGAGESVLTTAQFCAALRLLVEVLRQAGRQSQAESLEAWRREAAAAVGDAFRGGAFVRGYSDAGEAFGNAAAGHGVFLDVQAWAVLGRCGTVTQRRQALDTVLTACAGQPLTVLCPPWTASLPAALGRRALPAGEGANGGVALLESAWFLEAMALEGRSVEALARYQDLSLRRRCAAPGRPPYPVIAQAGRLNGPAALAAAWWPETAPAVDAAPEAAVMAWQEEVLRTLLTPARGG